MADAEQAPKDLIGMGDYYFVKKAPFQLPDNVKEILVKIAPWVILIFLILSIPALLLFLGVGAMFSPFGGATAVAGFGLSAVFLLIVMALEAISLPGLFARKMTGWRFALYARIAAFVEGIVAAFGPFSMMAAVVWGVIWLVITFYFMFQVRSLYHE